MSNETGIRYHPVADRVSGADGLGHRLRDLSLAALIATGITAMLLWTMQYLILSGQRQLDNQRLASSLSFIRVSVEETVTRKEHRPEKPPIPKAPPIAPPSPAFDMPKPGPRKLSISAAPVDISINLQGGFNLATGEGDYLPIIKVAPLYPRRAQNKGIEGHCVVQYTVTRTGTTKDVRVVDSECTSRLFNSASIKAALQFKYKPRIVNGNAVEVTGVRNQFNFKLSKN